MSVKKAPVVPVTIPNTLTVRTQGAQLLTPLTRGVQALSVRTATQYLDADEWLGRIRNARARWVQLMEPIVGPNERALKELKDQQKGIKTLNAEVDGPLEQLEMRVKGEMKAFKIIEQQQIEERRQAQEEEAAALRREAQVKAMREAEAKTAPMKAKLAEQRAVLEAKAVAVESDPDVDLNPVKGAGSVSRKVPKVRITDLTTFLAAMQDYAPKADLYEFWHPPQSLIDVEALTSAVMAIYRKQPGIVKSWPAIEEYTDVIIAGR